MPKRTVTKTEKRWAELPRKNARPWETNDLKVFSSSVTRRHLMTVYRMKRSRLVRVTLVYTLPAGRGRI